METATLRGFQKILNNSFKKEFEIRRDYVGRKELEILKYLKYDLMHLKDELFNEYDEPTLYKLAQQVEEFSNGKSEYNPFNDYPLCDALDGIYLDYSELCATYAEGLIDKSEIDLSNLESLKSSLAENMITTILKDYKNDMEVILQSSNYEEMEELVEELTTIEYDLPFELRIEYALQYPEYPSQKEIIDLKSLRLTEESLHDLKGFLRKNKDWESDYRSINDFLCFNELKEELERESQIGIRKNRR
ncbi:hypothetical protein [Helicobacter sp.]|uniref:hypothetical protein n=1 Tax=Helicobacter sp. TaxID=218 RepID=UPI0019B96089|nr:hypothetical protein [Helicobacter sp.]MBD5165135.1 hypothetical protein [Helicobacter sp.]